MWLHRSVELLYMQLVAVLNEFRLHLCLHRSPTQYFARLSGLRLGLSFLEHLAPLVLEDHSRHDVVDHAPRTRSVLS